MNDSNTALNPWLVSATLGVSGITGFFIGKLLGNRKLSANKILRNIRRDFRSEGPITGSWIENFTKPYQRFAFKTDTYQGGISRLEDGHVVNYNFLADAHTGTLLQLEREDEN